ncbi:hypothetical protein G9A89_017715 [Geosiphon pyriformis]|nr:hypothetical protein G9A89_017715 [Geosiphon pyriformis]
MPKPDVLLSVELLDAVIETMPILKGTNLCWSYLVSAKCAGCRKLDHTSLFCSVSEKKNVLSGASLHKTLSDLDKSRLAAIYTKCLVPVAYPVFFGGVSWVQIAGGSSFPSPPVWNVLLKAGSFSEMKPILLVSLELDNRFAALERSLASLAECVDILAKRLETPEPTVSQLSPGHQPLVTLSSQNQGVDIVMSEGLGVATGGETVAEVVVFNPAVISKMKKTLNNFSLTVMSFLAKLDNAGAGVVVVMNFFLARHMYKISKVPSWLLSIKLFFRNKLSVSILGLYAGAFSVAQFSQASNINSLIVKTVNESFFVILGGDFNENGSRKCASFKKCLDFGLVNALGGSSSEKSPTWSNFQGVVKTIDYVLISSNLVNTIAKFKDDTTANSVMFYDEFFAAKMHLDLDAMWTALYKVLCLLAEASSKFHKLELLMLKLIKESLDLVNTSVVKSFFLSDSPFNAIRSVLFKIRKSYHSSKMLEAVCIRESRIRSAINKRMKNFKLNKDYTIRSVLECPFCKVTLDHLVVDNKLVLKPDLVRTKMDCNMVSGVLDVWRHQYQPLEYVFDEAFSGVMCSIDFDKMSNVISNLFDEKAAGLSGISNELWKHYNRLVLDMLLVLLNFCLDCESKDVFTNIHPIALIETAHKILSKILSDRISSACSRFDVLREDNFSVLKSMTTQSLIFAIGSVIKDALEKNHELWLAYNSVGWEHLKASLVRIKMCDRFIRFFGGIHNGQMHNILDQGEMFSPLLWRIFYDPLLCEVKRQESVYGYRLDSRFVTRTGCFESRAGLTFFFTAGAFVDNTIWVGSSQATMQHILNIASKFFQINDISINNDKTVAILINCRVSNPCLLINGLLISIAKKRKSYQYLEIFLSTESCLKPSLARA